MGLMTSGGTDLRVPIRTNHSETKCSLAHSAFALLHQCRTYHRIRRSDEFWCFLEPPGYRVRKQGWKLHVSAVPISAAEILARTGEALIRHHCAFKFARTIDRVAELVSTHHDRTGAGKFITAYPDNDEHFALVAQELDWATDGFPGPEILSDRPYRLQSLVHYRYGAFAGVPVLTNDGDYESMLVAPDGSLEKDERGVCFSPPRWTTPPPSPGARTVQPILTAPNEVLLGSRFVVSKAIRHANRGGVYRGFDRTTTLPVVIKQARPHIGSTLFGSDVCDALRHEANLLDRFSQLGIAPRKIALFEQQKNVFLAEELIEGT